MTTDAVGGVWRYSIDLATGLASRGVSVVLAVLGPAPSPNQRAEAAGLRLVETGLKLDWTAENGEALNAIIAALRRLAGEHHATAAHLHAPSLVGAESWDIPVVAVAHSCVATWWRAVRQGPLPDDFKWRTDATATGLRTAAAIIAPTAAHAASLAAAYGHSAAYVVHNGSPEPSPPGRGLGEGLSASPHPNPEGEGVRRRAVLIAGRLWDEGKNAAALDRTAPLLNAPIRAAGPVAGPSGAAAALPNLQLLGNLDPPALRRAYASATVFCSMARYEPFGLAVLEAAHAGMRLVLSDIPSFRELWDGAATFVAHESELLPALERALDADNDGAAQARAARYTVDAMVAATLAVHRAAHAFV